MDIEELSVGNFVYLKNGKLLQGLQVTGIGDSFVNLKTSDEYPNVLYPLNDIEPIPLTKEILKKNEFIDYSFPFAYFCSKDRRIEVKAITNSGDGYWCVHVDNEDFETIGSCDVQYVHEMQHLLRLCRYEKEIEL